VLPERGARFDSDKEYKIEELAHIHWQQFTWVQVKVFSAYSCSEKVEEGLLRSL
jgi:hypothetical protein